MIFLYHIDIYTLYTRHTLINHFAIISQVFFGDEAPSKIFSEKYYSMLLKPLAFSPKHPIEIELTSIPPPPLVHCLASVPWHHRRST